MKLLLDTHAFVWWESAPEKLPPSVISLCKDRSNALLLSMVAAWEIQIKSQLGRLKFATPLADVIENQIRSNGFQLLPIELAHVLALENLSWHHKDPFDRLLIAQAMVEGVPVISSDPMFAKYPIQVLW